MSSRADDCIPAAEEIARASTSGAPKENEEVRATASVAPEELVALQFEINKLSDEFDRYYADWLGAKVRFVKITE